LSIATVAVVLLLGMSNPTNGGLNFLTITDFHLNYEITHVMDIDPSEFSDENDMDIGTFYQITSAIGNFTGSGQFEKDLSFVLCLGDVVGHHIFDIEDRKRLVYWNQRSIYSELLKMFPNIPIINIFGNNDSVERNYGKYTYNAMSPYETAMDSGFKDGFLSTGKVCSDDTGPDDYPCIESQASLHGYFSMKLQPDLLLIGLNSVMLTRRHNTTYGTEEQLMFLEHYLEQAKAQEMSVLIASHVPFGRNVFNGHDFLEHDLMTMYLDVIKEYLDDIIGILVSHTHMEEFQIIRTDDILHFAQYFTAGVSTSHGNSPSFKVFELENESTGWAIENYSTYALHAHEEVHEHETIRVIDVSQYYDFQSAYCSEEHTNINSCLGQVEFNQTLPRCAVGNPNYDYDPSDPTAFYIDL